MPLETPRAHTNNPALPPWVRHLPSRWRAKLDPLTHAVLRWIDAGGPSLGASIAFYAMFALAPMLVLAIAGAGLLFEAEAVRGQVFLQIRGLIGDEAARTVEAMIRSASLKQGSMVASLMGGATVVIGATGVFTELRRALNAMGEISPRASLVSAVFRVRLAGLALVLGMGFLSIASLVLSATLSAARDLLGSRLAMLVHMMTVLDLAASTLVLTLAFAALLRWLPDQPASSRGTWVGALVSAVLFTAGKHLLGIYLGTAGISSSYGAAGSFVMIMLWVYYTAQILLFGGAVAYALTKKGPRAAGPMPGSPAAPADH